MWEFSWPFTKCFYLANSTVTAQWVCQSPIDKYFKLFKLLYTASCMKLCNKIYTMLKENPCDSLSVIIFRICARTFRKPFSMTLATANSSLTSFHIVDIVCFTLRIANCIATITKLSFPQLVIHNFVTVVAWPNPTDMLLFLLCIIAQSMWCWPQWRKASYHFRQ